MARLAAKATETVEALTGSRHDPLGHSETGKIVSVTHRYADDRVLADRRTQALAKPAPSDP